MKQAKTMFGIGFLTMAVLANEIILTRIFSVTLWYHFAFLVISLALLGSGAAGVWLFLFPRPFAGERAPKMLPWLALGYGISTLLAFLIYREIPITVDGLRDGLDGREIRWLVVMYAELTVPFIFAGATIALALRHYQADAGRLYFADLFGAGIGCLISVVALNELGGPGAMLLVAVIGIFAAFLLVLENVVPLTTRLVTGAALLVGLVGLGLQLNDPWLKLELRRTFNNQQPIYEGWNSFSRITLYEDYNGLFGWGISEVAREEFNAGEKQFTGDHMVILIDEKAGTPIQRFDWNNGDEDREGVDFLRYDLTALPYYLRENANVFIIGPGGGRDVLTAHLFNAEHITGVELNPLIVDLVKYDYPDYAGHIYSRDHVDIKIDDARTYLSASDEQFDVIQASVIDTFAASAAGAFALSENGVYTVEAFEHYYDSLTDEGMINFSRWYYPNGPAETLRLVSTAMQGWENQGVRDVAQHVIVVANPKADRTDTEWLAGMLVKKTPFTPEEVALIAQKADELRFQVLYAPGLEVESPIADLVLAEDRAAFIASYPLDITPSVDNRPFFFNLVRMGDLGKDEFANSSVYSFGAEATRTLLITLGITFVLAFVLIILPLALGRGDLLRQHQGGSFIVYYSMLGLGFMLVQIPMVQKLNVYLGNPTYALVLVLFSILLFSGIGSYMTQRIRPEFMLSSIRLGLGLLLGLILLYTFLLPVLLDATQGLPLPGRALVVVMMLMPAGLLMGRPFPLGLRYVNQVGAGGIMPWLWAANGTLSVLGSVIAVIVAISAGFNRVFFLGLLCYGVALAMTYVLQRGEVQIKNTAPAQVGVGD